MHPGRDPRLLRVVFVRGGQPVDVSGSHNILDPAVQRQLLADLQLLLRRQQVQVELVAKHAAQRHPAWCVGRARGRMGQGMPG